MADHPLADIARNGRERVRIGISNFRGSRFADVRVYATAADGALAPTKAGVALRADMLRPTIEALIEAERLFLADGTLKRRAVHD